MSRAEIAWRVRSMLRDQTDIARVPLGLIPELKARTTSCFSDFEPGYRCSPVDRADWSGSISESALRWRSRLTDKADELLEDRLSYFDLKSVHHGQPFNWHRDHSAGVDSPQRLSILTDYRDFSTFGDCKLVWEPNRHHQFVVLARAYVATGDVKYAVKVAELMRSWIDANPFGYGMNWKSPLELGVRIINWVWAIDLLRDSKVFEDDLWHDVKQTIYRAMWDSQRKFSRGSSANNHLIGEVAGVFVGAGYFNTFPHAEKWMRKSQAVLEREIQLQTYDDGGTREHAFGYQFFVIQFFTQCLLVGDATGHPFSEQFRQRLHQMYLFLHELSADTGTPPNLGDKDDGYVLDLGDLPDQPPALLAVGALLFGDTRLRIPAESETVYWMTGDTSQDICSDSNIRSSTSFPDSGYHLLRGTRMSVFFDCAELGYGPIAAHGHADCLSIGVNIDGKPFIVDAGTYDYFTYPEWRNYFRETRAHNTVEVDGQSQSELLGPFMWGQRASARLIDWNDDRVTTAVAGEHDGYLRLSDPVIHRRKLILDKTANSLVISDKIVAKSNHRIRLHFHLDPACQATRSAAGSVEIVRGQTVLILTAASGILSCHSASDETKLGWISYGYHKRQASTCIQLEQDISGETTIQCKLTLRS